MQSLQLPSRCQCAHQQCYQIAPLLGRLAEMAVCMRATPSVDDSQHRGSLEGPHPERVWERMRGREGGKQGHGGGLEEVRAGEGGPGAGEVDTSWGFS